MFVCIYIYIYVFLLIHLFIFKAIYIYTFLLNGIVHIGATYEKAGYEIVVVQNPFCFWKQNMGCFGVDSAHTLPNW